MFRPDLLTNKRILVTGGGTGLGKEIADHLCSLGAKIILCGRRQSVLETTAHEMSTKHGRDVAYHVVDLRDADDIDAMFDRVWSAGPLYGLVNNAAGNFISRTEDLSSRGFDAIANTVFHGTFYATLSAGKRWIANGQKGNVLSIVTTWVKTGSPYVVPSAMSKAGVDVMTKSLAVEWGRHGIRLNAIAPGIFPTEGATARLRPTDNPHERELGDNPMRRLGKMSELTNLSAFLMAEECEWLTGETIAIDGAYHLAQGAYFTHYAGWTDDQWTEVRDRIKQKTSEDKQLRTVGL